MCDPVRLVYSGNDDDYEGILFSVLSAMRRTCGALDVSILTALLDRPDGKPVEGGKAAYLNALLSSRGDGSKLTLIDLSLPLQKLLRSGAAEAARPYELLPLLLDECARAEKLLCLCSSTLFCADASIVYGKGIYGRPFAAVCDKRRSFLYGKRLVDPSVMLIDVSRAREEGFFEKARKALCARRSSQTLFDAVNSCGVCPALLPDGCGECRGVRGDTLIRRFGRRGRLFRGGSYAMNDREYRMFENVYREYLAKRDRKF